MTIWINEQVDPSGIVYACVISHNEQEAQKCHESFLANLTEKQRSQGWVARLREVDSDEDIPVTGLGLT